MNSNQAYQDALARIFAFSETSRSQHEIQYGRARKLDRMRMLLGMLGNPQARYRSILVAGTKGKGSMAASLTAILCAAGYRVGRYTQPHLYSYCERTWANGRHITADEVASAFETMQPALSLITRHAADVGPLTTFDVGTALSLGYFAAHEVDVAVVEVGVGGAGDATNVLEPVISLIGPVGLDHCATLGPDLCSIAREKSGVGRAGADVVVGRQQPEALSVIEAEVSRNGGRPNVLGRDYWVDTCDPCRGPFTVSDRFGTLEDLITPLEGDFQRDNAAAAVIATRALARQGWTISDEAMRSGLATVEWHGRFQTVAEDPLTIVDGAHNASAAHALASTARACLAGRPVTIVLGMADDKDAAAFVDAIGPLANRIIVTRARHVRSTDPALLAEAVQGAGIPTEVVDLPDRAVRRAWATLPPAGAVLVTGSLFLVGDVMEWLLKIRRPA